MLLSSLRVLDLTDDRGHFAGHVLCQLGAEVVLVEPSGGHRTRHRGPYVDDVGDPEHSLEFLAYNRGKHSIELEAAADPQAEVDSLAANADVVISSGAIDLDLSALRERHPHLITASISAFGETGPKADWAATDLTISAASGTTSLTGDRDRAPVRIGRPQTWHNASADTVSAIMIAVRERRRSGVGQHIDTSAQLSFIDCSQFQLMGPLVGMEPTKRLPGAVQLGDFLIPWVYECADGHVTATFLFGPMIGPYSVRLMRWVCEEGFCDEELRDKNWIDMGMDIAEGRESISSFDEAIQALRAFLLTKTKDELLERSLADNLLFAPITTTADVLALGQLTDREFWQDVEVPRAAGSDKARFPGALAKIDGEAMPQVAPAPALNSAPIEVRERPRSPVVATEADAGSNVKALSGLKVLDFMWAVAGPGTTRMLADHGATVVKVESESKADVIRGVNPFIGEDGGQENALQFHSLNAGKLGLTLDLSSPEARDVVLDLVRWADVLTESFSPKAMTNWGFGYDELAKINPNLVMLSSCLMGQTGPMRMYAGFGTMAAAIAGFYPIVGWPDRAPAGPFTAYTDYISPKLSVPLVLAALEQRDRSGHGMHIDFAQLEGATHFLAPELLDEEINGRTAGRHGNADPHMSPHSAYPALGDDRWIAIACETDEQWRALAEAIGAPALADLHLAARLARAAELDGLVGAWTATREEAEVEAQLQALGIPSHRVNDGNDIIADPQIVHDGYFFKVPHPIHGDTWVERGCFTLSRTPAHTGWGGPTFGQHSMQVLEEILGYDGDQIADLVIAGAIA